MTYGAICKTNTKPSLIPVEPGHGYLILTPDENAALANGEPVVKRSGDCHGHFKITVKLTRPKTKKDRFAGL